MGSRKDWSMVINDKKKQEVTIEVGHKKRRRLMIILVVYKVKATDDEKGWFIGFKQNYKINK